ncbi:gamma-butyrobetaine hydroxylase-like domain-containing protein [Pseudomaricurvus sp. HS19]|uniref:gamma-butyrobetaine hydroxylase-like domain-containing protein n=1 Tax=Pseudomaricurvus sp. HS19 TaxID=2692626 RepID=UPI00136D3981|nr:DUF971 domain-containing protein [Pseudomaricurvus sp. HS19]MYM63588.1 DUF971 domain-containing protein [Pseudomaricurvus sp. HS19]
MNAPRKVTLHKGTAVLELQYEDVSARLPAELLRVYSPSAEVQGHGPGQETLQFGKRDVNIDKLEATGHYGLRIYFSDGHNTGLFSWNYLRHLADDQEALWQDYLQRLNAAGKSRDPYEAVVRLIDPN